MPRSVVFAFLCVALVACASTPDVDGAPPTDHYGAAKKHDPSEDDADDADDTEEPEDTTGSTYTPVTPVPGPAGLPPAKPIDVQVPTTTPAPTPVPVTTPPPAAAKPIVSELDVHWTKKSDTAEYSFDIVTRAGKLIGPCINSITVQKKLTITYEGTCTDPKLDVAIKDVAQVRVCWTEGGDWSKASCAAKPIDGTEADVTIPN